MTTLKTKQTIPETLRDLRTLFRRYEIDDWEPIPGTGDISYSVRYLKGAQWTTISSRLQTTKAANLRQCYQVIQYLFLWAGRGVGGVSQGVTFIGGGLVKVGESLTVNEALDEAYAVVGVEPTSSLEEIGAVYRAKIKFHHPDGVQDPQEKLAREERSKRLNAAYELIQKTREAK